MILRCCWSPRTEGCLGKSRLEILVCVSASPQTAACLCGSGTISKLLTGTVPGTPIKSSGTTQGIPHIVSSCRHGNSREPRRTEQNRVNRPAEATNTVSVSCGCKSNCNHEAVYRQRKSSRPLNRNAIYRIIIPSADELSRTVVGAAFGPVVSLQPTSTGTAHPHFSRIHESLLKNATNCKCIRLVIFYQYCTRSASKSE